MVRTFTTCAVYATHSFAQPSISNCFKPTLPSCGGSNFKRNIGYWGSWAARRPCAAYTPSQADWSGYTHAHFAFATISQDSRLREHSRLFHYVSKRSLMRVCSNRRRG